MLAMKDMLGEESFNFLFQTAKSGDETGVREFYLTWQGADQKGRHRSVQPTA